MKICYNDEKLKSALISRMISENIKGLSDAEVERTLMPCVLGWRLVPIARKMIDAGLLTVDEVLPL